jgi:hypothetical protein
MMAISRLRFAPFLALVLLLAGATIVAPDACAYRDLVSQIMPDDEGEIPIARGGSSSDQRRIGKDTLESKPIRVEELSRTKTLFSAFLELIWPDFWGKAIHPSE